MPPPVYDDSTAAKAPPPLPLILYTPPHHLSPHYGPNISTYSVALLSPSSHGKCQSYGKEGAHQRVLREATVGGGRVHDRVACFSCVRFMCASLLRANPRERETVAEKISQLTVRSLAEANIHHPLPSPSLS